MSTKWNKRKLKLRGLCNQIYSGICLRYSKINRTKLLEQIAQHAIDRVHIGCGTVILPGWLNVLYETREEYGRLIEHNRGWFLNYNLLRPWPLNDESVQYIAGSHVIEHLDLNHGIQLLNEAYRVMKPGGVIRLSCPDLELYARHYVERNQDFYNHPKIQEWCAFKAAKTPGEIFAAKAYDSGGAHKWFYDFESLAHILQTAGFKQVKKCSRLEGQVPDLEKIELADRELESVYVEAVK